MKKIVIVRSGILLLLALHLRIPVFPCTAFLVNTGDTVIVGNNEDYYNPNTRMWFVPGDKTRYGAVYFGFDDGYSQGGMNEKGLFYDGFWVAPEEHTHADLEMECPREWFDSILKTCATVEEALKIIKKHKLHVCTSGKLMYGDAAGDSVIIGNGAIIRKTGNEQISTNFFENRVNGNGITCERYLKAEEMIREADKFTPALAAEILKETSVRFTQYSVVYDLVNRSFILYHFKNFETSREYSLKKELKKGERHYNIPGLFPVNPEFRKVYYSKITPHNNESMALFLVVLMILFSLIPILFGIARGLERKKLKERRNHLNTAHILLTIASIAALLLSIALRMIPAVFILGLPDNTDGLTLMQKIYINIPGILLILILVLLTIWLKAGENGWWTNNLRKIHIFFLTLLIIFEALIFYWGLFKILL